MSLVKHETAPALAPGAVLAAQVELPCQACGAEHPELLFEQAGVPTNSCLLLPNRDAALAYPRGDLRLTFCRSCGFIQNSAFDPGLVEYSSSYEETQGFSPRFRQFARQLAQHLVGRYAVRGQTVLEIGCGKGEFLALMCELGGNRGVGIDPSYLPERLHSPAADRLTFLTERYGDQHGRLGADVILCRHTLEHIQDVRSLVQTVRRSIEDAPNTLVFFEVPDVRRVLAEAAYWDLYYEHCSYFSLGSLARLFRASGFEPLELTRGFDDQYLLLMARPVKGGSPSGGAAEDDLAELDELVAKYRVAYDARVGYWDGFIRTEQAAGRRIAIWGSGSKAVSFLSSPTARQAVETVVDINPHKHGKYLAGIGHVISAPESLVQSPPDTVIVMNPIYLEEIRELLAGLGLSPRVLAL